MSAQTMRRLVKLAHAKQEKLNNPSAAKKKHVVRGKTMTNVRVQRGSTTEQKVAHRLSVTTKKEGADGETLHIRSFSLPKEKTPALSEQAASPTTPDTELEQKTETPSVLTEEPEPEVEVERVMNHSSHPTITITPAIQDLPSSMHGNLDQQQLQQQQQQQQQEQQQQAEQGQATNNPQQLGVDNKYASHMSTVSDTHTINSEFSETVYTEHTEYTNNEESHYGGYTNLKPSSKNHHRGRGGGSRVSIGSASSMTVSTYDSSQKKATPNIPALEAVNEPSANNINTTKYADEDLLGNPSSFQSTASSHISQQSVVPNVQAPQITLNDEDDEEDDDEAAVQRQPDPQYTQAQPAKARGSIDLTDGDAAPSNSGSIWSCLMCGCCANSASSTEMNTLVSHEASVPQQHHQMQREQEQEQGDDDGFQLDNDDWKTFKSAGSRIRRPTQYTTATNNEDSTINVDDVRMWDDPFGKGASGRVFKGVYLPLCQVLALKVTSRLDNDNVKQILGEFKQQQEYLPDCDELMRIHGWYRNLATNEIAVALEYMDMGSVFDSCFQTNTQKSAASEEEIMKTGHKQIYVDKLGYDQMRFIARQCLLGLHALHTNQPPLIHRDIKPQNILLSSYGNVKIADFGLLIELKNGVCSDSKGTSKYFSPERIQGSFDTLADIWALGITLIEIYKQELISAEDLDWFKIVEDGIDISDFLPATTPTEFADFLKQCLQHQSENRPSAKQLLSHQFITRKWGNPLVDNNMIKNITVPFSKEGGNQKLLDKILSWLEEWILIDSENNAKLFLEGDSEYLKQCVLNLSRYSGLPPKYIDRYIADLYREYTQFD